MPAHGEPGSLFRVGSDADAPPAMEASSLTVTGLLMTPVCPMMLWWKLSRSSCLGLVTLLQLVTHTWLSQEFVQDANSEDGQEGEYDAVDEADQRLMPRQMLRLRLMVIGWRVMREDCDASLH